MNILARFSARSLAAATLASLTLIGGGCISASGSGGLGSNTKKSLGLFLESVDWGRLVDVRDQNGVLVETDVLINHLLESDGINFELITNPVSQKETLNILQDASSANFATLLATAKSNLENVSEKNTNSAPPFTEIARNATIRLQFSEFVDPNTVDFTTVQVYTGTPPLLAFTGRYVVNNDAATGKGNIFFDTTVSATEAAQEAVPQNAVGFPASSDSLSTNLAIKIPTEPDPLIGQPKVLTSLSGNRRPSLRAFNPDPFEDQGNSVVLVRAARTGNQLDPFNGFLLDNDRPNLLGVQVATINTISSVSSGVAEFLYTMNATECKPMVPKVGDVFEVGVVGLMMVTDVLSSADPNNYSVRAAIEADDNVIAAGATSLAARYTTRYTPQDASVQPCYLEIQPPPVVGLPVTAIDEQATVTVRFDEPINAGTVRSMSTFVVASPDDNVAPTAAKDVEAAWFRQVNPSETVGDFIERQRGYDYRPDAGGAATGTEFGGRILFGAIEAVDGNRQFTLSPVTGWIDPDPTDAFENYVVALRGGTDGIEDLSGNSLDLVGFVAGNDGQNSTITVAHPLNSPEADTKYFALLAKAFDEDGDGQAEWAGQTLQTATGLTGRAPMRFSRGADNSSPAMANRITAAPVNEPLNPAGAVVMHLYRPQEFGFGYPDATEYNMTVEGFNWSPQSGVVLDEVFGDISLSLGTSKFLPDEFLDPITGATVFPNSGLVTTGFDDNILGFTSDGSSGVDEVEVFRSSYTTNTIELFTNNGTAFLPWPDFTTNYIWRDTTIPQDYLGTAAAPGSQGSPDVQYQVDTGNFNFWAAEMAPSVGLPLLARFRTYPQSESIGINNFAVTQMIPTGNVLVNYRIWSSGGQDGSGVWHLIQPDNPAFGGTSPTGGYLAGGAPTATQGDSLIYWAQADFAQDVSRMYSHWFDCGAVLAGGDVRGTVLEPANADQPVGTSIQVEYRGSASVSHFGNPDLNPSPLTGADTPFDDYGDSNGIGSVSTPSAWTTELSDLEDQGYRFIQIRVTFFANADLGLSPELDGLGIVWKN